MTSSNAPRDNRLLGLLPEAVSRAWLPHLEAVEMPLGQVLYDGSSSLSHIFFPTTAIVCPLIVLNNGDTAAMAVIGREGMIGISALVSDRAMPNRAVVHGAGAGFRIRADIARQSFDSDADLRQLLLRHMHAVMTQVAQNAACNRHHSVMQQLCRWLLLTLDRLAGPDLQMTHDLIAQMLGVRREGVTMAAFKLQAAGVIRYARGHMSVLDRAGLEQGACECYETITKAYGRVPAVAGHAIPNRVCSGLASLAAAGQRDQERGALVDAGTANRHRSAMRLDKFAHHRQPDAEARAIQARGTPLLHERLEDVWQGFRRNADPVV